MDRLHGERRYIMKTAMHGTLFTTSMFAPLASRYSIISTSSFSAALCSAAHPSCEVPRNMEQGVTRVRDVYWYS